LIPSPNGVYENSHQCHRLCNSDTAEPLQKGWIDFKAPRMKTLEKDERKTTHRGKAERLN
jgi:hypothetical protein